MNQKSITMMGLCLLLFSACQQGGGEQSAVVEYPLQTLKAEDRELSVKYSAVIEGKQDVEVRPQVSGTITRVCVEEGASVRKGQVLFIIDQVPYQAALQKAKAAVATAEAGLATAKLNLDGKEQLYRDKVVSDFDLRTTQNAYKTAEATLLQAQAELRDAENNLSYTEVKSPVDGQAGMTSFRVGALVSPSMSEALVSVSDNSEMYVYFSLTEKQVLALTEQYGSTDKALESFPDITLQLNDGCIYGQTGRIDVISGMIDKTTGTVRLRAVFGNKGKRLMSGGMANVVMPYKREQCLVIPQGATYEIQNRIFAYKVVDGKTVSAPITVFEINDGKEYIVEEGLSEGDVIITEGAGLVKAGTAVVAQGSNN
ncbi:efflux RND transporter periplasmic adaptor subunit [Parabacteroides distasonis]|uniref:efflux RND transporter periplasmic adaptor subunit n=3 Tax=Parabacteroides distasonis TaxID=823 RepID=UPI00189EED36|nr:efflux RND transporter periplasmic adaptor subunit [Parabacteroides distasonis]MDB9152639.1 efflux RND transporter periplasmic adaptor subunit [Parabacteroides distasonis]MDB9157215.1 efflux RND transporter periplasmic adaptor subunit [Parabacteroides distasonis]MDB9166229.1 efflux RND transporter periplasmic adaptor subunit [Parabacteroides distasonis]MDB9170649.1 efflux RND transporter periplasmic adaptor subunit [Parabacteroides distasonis]